MVFGFIKKDLIPESSEIGTKKNCITITVQWNHKTSITVRMLKDYILGSGFKCIWITRNENTSSNYCYFSKNIHEYMFTYTIEPKWICTIEKIMKHLSKLNKHLDIHQYFLNSITSYRKMYITNELKGISDLETLPGYTEIRFSKEPSCSKQWSIIKDNEKYFVTCIIWISPFIESILYANTQKSIEWDCTFKSTKPYVLSIPSLIIMKTLITLGFILYHSECFEIFDEFYSRIKHVNNGIITKISHLSDMGSSLVSFFNIHRLKHYFCQRHILEAFGNNSVLMPVVHLLLSIDSLEMRSIIFDQCNDYLNRIARTHTQINNLNSFLKKMGIEFRECLEVIDESLFQSFINEDRKKYGVPTTTNHLESIHGHLNKIASRRKSMFSTLQKLINYSIDCTNSFEKRVRTNINRKISQTRNLFSLIAPEVLESEIRDFSTSENFCLCGKSHPPTGIYSIRIPCVHQIYLKYNFGALSDLSIPKLIINPYNSLLFKMEDPPHFSTPGRKIKKTGFKNCIYSIKTPCSKFVEETIDKVSIYTKIMDRDMIFRTIIQQIVDIKHDLSFKNRIKVLLKTLFESPLKSINEPSNYYWRRAYNFEQIKEDIKAIAKENLRFHNVFNLQISFGHTIKKRVNDIN